MAVNSNYSDCTEKLFLGGKTANSINELIITLKNDSCFYVMNDNPPACLDTQVSHPHTFNMSVLPAMYSYNFMNCSVIWNFMFYEIITSVISAALHICRYEEIDNLLANHPL